MRMIFPLCTTSTTHSMGCNLSLLCQTTPSIFFPNTLFGFKTITPEEIKAVIELSTAVGPKNVFLFESRLESNESHDTCQKRPMKLQPTLISKCLYKVIVTSLSSPLYLYSRLECKQGMEHGLGCTRPCHRALGVFLAPGPTTVIV